MYKEFMDAVQIRGAVVVFLPSFCPQFNSIETGFSFLKRWIQKNAHLIFSRCSETVMDLSFECCVVDLNTPVNLMAHSGYGSADLKELIIKPSVVLKPRLI